MKSATPRAAPSRAGTTRADTGQDAGADTGRDAGPPWLSGDEQRVWRTYLEWSRRLFEALDRDLQDETDLELDDYGILAYLSESDQRQLRMTDLADRLTFSRSRLTRRVDRLVADGLIERRRCQLDGRVVYAGLTERGWEIVQSAAPSHVRSVRARLFDALGPADIAILDEMLPRLLTRLRESDRA